MSIALQEQIKSALFRIAQLENKVNDLEERIAMHEKKATEAKKTISLQKA